MPFLCAVSLLVVVGGKSSKHGCFIVVQMTPKLVKWSAGLWLLENLHQVQSSAATTCLSVSFMVQNCSNILLRIGFTGQHVLCRTCQCSHIPSKYAQQARLDEDRAQLVLSARSWTGTYLEVSLIPVWSIVFQDLVPFLWHEEHEVQFLFPFPQCLHSVWEPQSLIHKTTCRTEVQFYQKCQNY